MCRHHEPPLHHYLRVWKYSIQYKGVERCSLLLAVPLPLTKSLMDFTPVHSLWLALLSLQIKYCFIISQLLMSQQLVKKQCNSYKGYGGWNSDLSKTSLYYFLWHVTMLCDIAKGDSDSWNGGCYSSDFLMRKSLCLGLWMVLLKS